MNIYQNSVEKTADENDGETAKRIKNTLVSLKIYLSIVKGDI